MYSRAVSSLHSLSSIVSWGSSRESYQMNHYEKRAFQRNSMAKKNIPNTPDPKCSNESLCQAYCCLETSEKYKIGKSIISDKNQHCLLAIRVNYSYWTIFTALSMTGLLVASPSGRTGLRIVGRGLLWYFSIVPSVLSAGSDIPPISFTRYGNFW